MPLFNIICNNHQVHRLLLVEFQRLLLETRNHRLIFCARVDYYHVTFAIRELLYIHCQLAVLIIVFDNIKAPFSGAIR